MSAKTKVQISCAVTALPISSFVNTIPTDKQLYLHKTSNHPPSTKSGLAYGLGLRLRRICEKQEDYQVQRRELKVQLRKRGYSGKDIEKQLQKVDMLKREDLLNIKNKEKKEERVPLVLTFFETPAGHP